MMILILILSSYNTRLRTFCQMKRQCAPITASVFHAIDNTMIALGIDTSPCFPSSSGRGSIIPISPDYLAIPFAMASHCTRWLLLMKQLYVLLVLGRMNSSLTSVEARKKSLL